MVVVRQFYTANKVSDKLGWWFLSDLHKPCLVKLWWWFGSFTQPANKVSDKLGVVVFIGSTQTVSCKIVVVAGSFTRQFMKNWVSGFMLKHDIRLAISLYRSSHFSDMFALFDVALT